MRLILTRKHALALISLLCLWPNLAIAQEQEPVPIEPHEQSEVHRRVAQTMLYVGRFFESAGYPTSAATFYISSANYAPNIGDFLRLKGAEMLLSKKKPWRQGLERIEREGALAREVPGRALLQTKTWHALHGDILADDLPVTLLSRALDEPTSREEACAWVKPMLDSSSSPTPWSTLSKRLTNKDPRRNGRLGQLAQRIHARCDGDDKISWSEARRAPLTSKARIQRAEMLYAGVHYYWTLAELERVDFEKLDNASWCRAEFRRARATYRIRKLRKDSDDIYLGVAKKCTDAKLADYRIRSLYAVAKRNFDRGITAPSKDLFEQILKDYPERSHADDALLYLARIARSRRRGEEEVALMKRALEQYPGGDMVHELVWEVLEGDFRKGDFKTFLSKLSKLDLPDHDDNYLSQGRLEYFQGYAHAKLGQKKQAKQAYLETWRAYPFSFYGYMAWLALDRMGVDQKDLSFSRGATSKEDLAWLFDEEWQQSDAAMLAEVGMYGWAAQVEELRTRGTSPSSKALWRLAWLYHQQGNFPLSHNIARRKISKRPWAAPEQGRALRWEIAWPNPFKQVVLDAVAAEAKQHKPADAVLRPELPMAIMREESSFIPDIESYAGALGLMQLMPATALDHDSDIDGAATPDKLIIPEVNIRVATDHLFTLADRLHSHPAVMAAGYNAGAGAARRWLRGAKDRHIAIWVEDIPYFQARNYTKRVIGSYLAYQWLLGHDTFDKRVGEDAPEP